MSPPRAIGTLARLVVVFLSVIGITGLIAPATFLSVLAATITTTGLLTIGAIRIGIGVVLFRVAPVTRAPVIIRVLGGLIALGGVVTLLIGPDRARLMFDRMSGFGPATVRAVGIVAILIAAGLGYALSNDRVAS